MGPSSRQQTVETVSAIPTVANNAVGLLAHNVLWTFAARLLIVMFSVGSGLIVARWLGAAALGVYAVLGVTISNAVQIGGAGLTAANIYFASRNLSEIKPIAANAALFALIAGTLLAFSILGLALSEARVFRDIPFSLVVFTAITVPFHLLMLFGLNVFLILRHVKRFAFLEALAQGLILINAVIVLIAKGAGLGLLVALNSAVIGVVGLLVSILAYTQIEREVAGGQWRVDGRLFSQMMRYGMKFNGYMAAIMLVMRADMFIVNRARGPAEAGVYAVASQAGLLIMLLPNVIGTLLFPRVASLGQKSAEFTSVVARHTAFVMAIICLTAIPAAFMLPIVYGASFHDAVVQFWLLLPGVYLMGLEMVLVQHFVGTGLPMAILVSWFVTLGVNITLNLMIVPSLGARGAALVSSASYALAFILISLYFRASTRKSLSAILVLRRDEMRRLFGLRYRAL